MIKHKTGDLFTENVDVIAHQVNCQGKMGSGVAKQVRELFPHVYNSYRDHCQQYASIFENPAGLLGSVFIMPGKRKDGSIVLIANLFAQNTYGYDGNRYTDYDALRKCMQQLHLAVKDFEKNAGKRLTIGMPFRIGCGLGGGDWNIVYRIIEEELGDLSVTLYELP